jgi:hypothetical protein
MLRVRGGCAAKPTERHVVFFRPVRGLQSASGR